MTAKTKAQAEKEYTNFDHFEPTEEDRQFVLTMAGYGIAKDDIARCLRGGVDAELLEQHFAAALRQGQVEANAKVAESLFNQATGKTKIIEDGKTIEAAIAPVAAAAIFWLKSHGWNMGDGLQPIPVAPDAPALDPSRLTMRELQRLEALLEKATVRKRAPEESNAENTDIEAPSGRRGVKERNRPGTG